MRATMLLLQQPARARALAVAGLALLVAVALSGCGAQGPSGSPPGGASVAPGGTPSPAVNGSTGPGSTGAGSAGPGSLAPPSSGNSPGASGSVPSVGASASPSARPGSGQTAGRGSGRDPASSAPGSAPVATPVTSPTPTPSPLGPIEPVTLPVVDCTVTDGAVAGAAPTPSVHSLLVRLPAPLANRLIVYGIETQQLILAPMGWRCTGLIGADGSSHVTIMDPTDEHAGVVVDGAPGAPYVGVLDLACSLFPEADRLLHSTFGFNCPRQHAAGEQLENVSTDVVRFVDPPGVRAVGALSGGPYPVSGAVIYHAESDNLVVAFQASCAMPSGEEATCDAIVGDWIARVSAAYNVAP